MRQSLSENRSTYSSSAGRAVLLAIALSAVLAVVAVVDQVGGHSLADHVTAMYAPFGKRPDPGLIYGLVYTVAAVGALLWLPVFRAVRSHRRSAPVLAMVVTVVTAGLAAVLFGASEYGSQIFPAWWGILAILPAVAGVLAVVLVRRTKA